MSDDEHDQRLRAGDALFDRLADDRSLAPDARLALVGLFLVSRRVDDTTRTTLPLSAVELERTLGFRSGAAVERALGSLRPRRWLSLSAADRHHRRRIHLHMDRIDADLSACVTDVA